MADGVMNNPSAQLVHIPRPTEKATIGRENYKRIEEPRPYMDEEYLKKSTQQIRWTSLPRWSRPSSTKSGRAHLGGLVHSY